MDVKTLFKKAKGKTLVIPDTDRIDGEYAKNLRVNVFGMSQNAFANAIGLQKKTIEKWENGSIRPSGSARKLLYLLKEKPELMKELYRFEKEQEKEYVTFVFPIEQIGFDEIRSIKKETAGQTYKFTTVSSGNVNYA